MLRLGWNQGGRTEMYRFKGWTVSQHGSYYRRIFLALVSIFVSWIWNLERCLCWIGMQHESILPPPTGRSYPRIDDS